MASVLVGLFVIMGGAAHYGALYVSHKRHKDFVERYIKHARHLAWGEGLNIPGIPGTNGGNGSAGATGFESNTPPEEQNQAMTWNRKQKRMAEKESRKAGKNPKAARVAKKEGISTPVEAELTSGPVGAKKRVMAENGKVLIVDSVGNVYVEETTEEGERVELLLDIEAIESPTISDTVLVRLPMWLYNKSVGRFIGSKEAVLDDQEDAEFESLEDEAIMGATSLNANEETQKRKPRVRQRT